MANHKKTTKVEIEPFLSEFERGLLSLLYKKVDLFAEFKQKASGDYFLYPPHRLIFTGLNNLYSNKDIKSIDLETLSTECNNLGLKDLGVSNEYLMLITQGGIDKGNFDFYFKKVKSAYLKYTLAQKLVDNYQTVIENAPDSEETLSGDEIVQDINNDLANLLSFQGGEEDGVLLSSVVDSFVKDRKSNPVDVKGLRTGFDTLDQAINGLMPGTLTVVAGAAGQGKSTFLLNVMDNVAIDSDDPLPVLYISTEMLTEEDLSRLIAVRTALPERGIQNGTLFNDPQRQKVLKEGCDQIKKSKIYHIYTPDFNAAKICNYIYYYQLRYNIGLAIFDYIKLDTVGDKLKEKREDQILGDLTTSLKNMAGKIKIPILAACQVNNNTGRVADSDRIIRYANYLIMLEEQTDEEIEQHNDIYKYGTHWLKILKGRAGPKSWIPIRFWKHCVTMVEADTYKTNETDEQNERRNLTTPEEYEAIKERAFKIDTVAEVSERSDAFDIEFPLEGDNNEP